MMSHAKYRGSMSWGFGQKGLFSFIVLMCFCLTCSSKFGFY